MIYKKLSFPINENNTIGYWHASLIELKTNPNHSFNEDEVKKLLEFEENNRKQKKVLQKSLSINFQKTQDRIESLKLFIKNSIHEHLNEVKNIATIGWYISPTLVSKLSLSEINYYTQKENLNKFEKKIIEQADEHIPSIIKNCTSLFPERKPIFEEIFKLYQSKSYYSIINTCYSQADGMCNSIWNFGFFDKERPKYELKSKDIFMENNGQMSSFFAQQLEINQNEITINSKDKIFNNIELKVKSYNRHLVLHGHSVDYGTKVNAIRAIYLLDFICYFVENKN